MANYLVFSLLLRILVSFCLMVAAAGVVQQWLRWLILKLLRHNNHHPPGPIPIPVLGNLLHLVSSSAPHRSLAQLARKYGPIFYLQLGIVPTVIVSTPTAAQQILLAHDKSLASRPFLPSCGRLLYGIDKLSSLSPYNDHWRSIRKFYSLHLLNARRHQEVHVPIVRKEILRAIMGDVYVASHAGSEVNLSLLFSSLAQNFMYRIVLNKLPVNGRNFLREVERLLSVNRIGEFVPVLGFLDYSLNGAIDRCHRYMDAILEGAIAEREEEIKSRSDSKHPAGTQKKCMLDIMLAWDSPMERAKIKSMILELMSGGNNTTASTLDWAMAELLNNERAMKKAMEELDGVVGKDRMVTLEDITEKMPYIRAVVKETLRLHPPLPLLLPHYAAETCEVELQQQQTNSADDDDSTLNYKVDVVHRIAAGTRVLINIWEIGRDEKTWGSSANEFAPERFLGVHGGVDVKGHDFGLLPFGSGRRMCPGSMLGMSMLELTIATFLHCFEWKKSHEGPVDMTEDFGLNLIRRSQLHALPTSFRLNPTLAPTITTHS